MIFKMRGMRVWAITLGMIAVVGLVAIATWREFSRLASGTLPKRVIVTPDQNPEPQNNLGAAQLLSENKDAPPTANNRRAPASTGATDGGVGTLEFNSRTPVVKSRALARTNFENRYRWSGAGLSSMGMPEWKILSAATDSITESDRIFNFSIAHLARGRSTPESFHGPIALYDPNQKRIGVLTGKVTVRFKESGDVDPDQFGERFDVIPVLIRREETVSTYEIRDGKNLAATVQAMGLDPKVAAVYPEILSNEIRTR